MIFETFLVAGSILVFRFVIALHVFTIPVPTFRFTLPSLIHGQQVLLNGKPFVLSESSSYCGVYPVVLNRHLVGKQACL